MKIAQVSPLAEPVPPIGYGGTERIIAYLSDELIRRGHEVTLFASGDSRTKGRLVAGSQRALRLDSTIVDPQAHEIFQLAQVLQEADTFDIIHFHTGYAHFPLFRGHQTPGVTTFHGRLDIADLNQLFSEFADVPVVSISNSQRQPFPQMNWQGTVYHGLPLDLYKPGDGRGNYLAFLGRICPEKRVDRAIKIAQRAEMKIKIAAKIDNADREYMEDKIRPLLDDQLVEFVGEVDRAEKQKLLGDAYALLFPIDWPEPFGLVMVESMACGTPVVAYRAGSVPEVVDPGLTGFIVESIDQSVEALKKMQTLDRKLCREVFERRFSSARMALDYIKIYEKLLNTVPR